LNELNAQFDSLNAQYQKDCILAPVDQCFSEPRGQCKTPQRDKMNPLGKKIIALQADIDASKR
jgi:hypothetical protein